MAARKSSHRSPSRFIARMLDGAKTATAPGFIEPCVPTLRPKPPTGGEWVHEIKYDGYRAQAHFDKRPRIYTRRGHDWAERMPTIAQAIAALPANGIVLDGELVALDRKCMPSFPEISAQLANKRSARLVYYAFDLLYLDGFDLRGAALIERKRVLRDLLARHGSDRILYCDHVEDDGAVVLASACALGLEGIVSKKRDAPYRSGKRPEWIKTKCTAWREANRERWRVMEGRL